VSAEAAAAGTRARDRAEQPWIVGGVGAGLAALTRLPVGWTRAGVLLMIVGTKFWLGLGIYAAAALVVPHRGRWLPGWSNVVGVLRVASLGLIAFLSRNVGLDHSGIFGYGPEVWVPIGGLVLFGWVAVLSAGRVEPSDEDRAVALASLPALALAAVLLIAIWVVPGARAVFVLDVGLMVVGGVFVLMRPRMARSAVGLVPVAALGLLAIVCAFSGVGLSGGVGHTHIAARTPASLVSAERAMGTVTFDASRWRGVAGRTERVNLSVGIGNIWIIVPQDVNATVDARLGHGQMVAGFGPDTSSFFVHRRFFAGNAHYPRRFLRPGRLQINAHVGDGCLIVVESGESFSSSNC
jgi:phage shock protein PspC (stress-responsive transcriptional regulator)